MKCLGIEVFWALLDLGNVMWKPQKKTIYHQRVYETIENGCNRKHAEIRKIGSLTMIGLVNREG